MITYTVESGGPCQHCRRPIIRCHPTAEWIHTCLTPGCRDAWRHTLTGNSATPAPKVTAIVPVYARRTRRNQGRWVA